LLADAVRELGADVLSLQEVDRDQPRSGKQDLAALVADAMGCAPGNWRFAATLNGTPGDRWTPAPPDKGGPAYGIALFSRYPVREWAELLLSAAPMRAPVAAGAPSGRRRILLLQDEPRLTLVAVIEGPDGPFTAICTHLSFVPGWNIRQLRQLTRQLRDFPRPLVLAGDLNVTGSLPALVTGWRPAVRAHTFPAAHPKLQLDHVLTDGFIATAGHAIPLIVSDHRALAVDLTVLTTGLAAARRPLPRLGEQPAQLVTAEQRRPDEPGITLPDVEKPRGDLLRLDSGDVGPGRPVAGQLDG
jgi:endonuclease/exonuclease/phosphatase family metal-dependent hydrolase